MKSAKPFSLFGAASKKAFFHDIHHQIQEQNEKDDSGLRTVRTQFLLRATSAVAQSFPETAPEDACYVGSVNQKDFSVASKWFNRILDVGECWNLDLDEIRRHYICELYSGGQDLLAHEIKSSVTNNVLLASQLLLLTGQRIHKVVFDCADPTARLGVLTPDVSTFLMKLGDITLRCNNVPLDLTATLLDQILAILPDNSKEHKLASALKSAIADLLNIINRS